MWASGIWHWTIAMDHQVLVSRRGMPGFTIGRLLTLVHLYLPVARPVCTYIPYQRNCQAAKPKLLMVYCGSPSSGVFQVSMCGMGYLIFVGDSIRFSGVFSLVTKYILPAHQIYSMMMPFVPPRYILTSQLHYLRSQHVLLKLRTWFAWPMRM
ncbi:hypothetical protein BX600DRAFT_471466 [Xylariales sp. PMI_506]|nr:hypothetical protein BX600DRAFT_471466 [Xylariales sp. PMI_506]